ncbi:MAG: CoA transferase [Deltaproteobacteria bacterium]|nr:CoA transferase [Deltaproteobacteria bacterium]MBW1947742.1 CoA transferase [Deltaproteobacteria bacterium]MBW2051562.1 CoA transferase [Deltaproteobacteria bacterium]MBW2141311.1 CoA transferase [Deltaproteobacteria bacterium]MBW2323291.1 CoA transferase [Deltaproteobacteria bacterium]
MGKLPLEGIKVADFTWVWTGPTTTKVLADFGATVVKIESDKRLDVWRIQPPFKDDVPGPDRGAIFNSINTGKLSVTIDLSQPKGKELAKKFVAWADIVTDNYAGGAMERMGLGYEALKEIKPDIIMMSSALMGQTGPWHDSPGYGDQLSAISGLHEISGWPDRIPGEIGFYTDFIAPRFNALTILAALDYRRRTGKGQYLDIAQHQGSVHFIAPILLDYAVNKRVATRQGNLDDYAAPHGCYRCQGEDRWCAIVVRTDEEWQSFCDVLRNPAWTKDPKFATLKSRKENEDELNKMVDEWTSNQSDEDVMVTLQSAGVPAGRVGNTEDQMENDPHLKFRNFYQEREHPEIGKYRPPRQPCVLSKTPCEIKRAPLIGEHNEYVFKELLCLTDEEIEELIIDGIIQ